MWRRRLSTDSRRRRASKDAFVHCGLLGGGPGDGGGPGLFGVKYLSVSSPLARSSSGWGPSMSAILEIWSCVDTPGNKGSPKNNSANTQAADQTSDGAVVGAATNTSGAR